MAEESIFCDVVRICSTVIVEEGVFQMKCEMPFVSALLSVCLVLYREKKSKTCERLETMFWHNSIVLAPAMSQHWQQRPQRFTCCEPLHHGTGVTVSKAEISTQKKQKKNEKTVVQKQSENKGIKHFSQVILQWKAKIFGLSKTREPLPLSQKVYPEIRSRNNDSHLKEDQAGWKYMALGFHRVFFGLQFRHVKNNWQPYDAEYRCARKSTQWYPQKKKRNGTDFFQCLPREGGVHVPVDSTSLLTLNI